MPTRAGYTTVTPTKTYGWREDADAAALTRSVVAVARPVGMMIYLGHLRTHVHASATQPRTTAKLVIQAVEPAAVTSRWPWPHTTSSTVLASAHATSGIVGRAPRSIIHK